MFASRTAIRPKGVGWALAFVVAMAGCSTHDDSLEYHGSGTVEIVPGVYSFSDSAPAPSADDLSPLFRWIGDAQYVGLGESVHTSGGFNAAKARIVKGLIERGTRVFALEAPRTPAARVEQHLQTCQGPVRDALANRGIYGSFADDNMEALLGWICEFNTAHPTDKVHFYGIDVQQPEWDYPELEAFMAAANPQDSRRLIDGLRSCQREAPITRDQTKPYPKSELEECLRGLDAVDGYIAENRAQLEAASSKDGIARAEMAAISFRSWQTELEAIQNNDEKTVRNVRDVAMHRIFRRTRDLHFAGKKVVISAHNTHVTAHNHEVTDNPIAGATSFGTELAKEVGSAYVAVGVVGYYMEINRPGHEPVAMASATSLEGKLHALGHPSLIVDTESPWIGKEQVYMVGEPEGGNMVPSHQYRALVFLEHSPPMKALFW
ncbi:erythromycin esterase family protein [Pendulispora brunnea]|uniref:Erythromycin esterase family protein n=1 Tax=Pendulispora brunnea TaxID=2905690 RepID=A0ABZ2KCD3_9BACT